ncbi:MAG: HAD-IIIA family hydrolase [Verrucomicrobia bacterium]|nr:HAD-IIIA family hydrolase [Verrucomicrobiota bacterium]
MNQAVILAGGLGTRLKARLGDLPKPLVPIAGKPLLEHQMQLVRRYGISRVTLFLYHKPEVVEQALGDGRRWGVRLESVRERAPLGTAGALIAGLEHLDDEFLVLYGDTFLNVDLQRFASEWRTTRAEASLFLHPNNHPFDSDLVECAEDGRVTALHNRPHPPGVWRQNLVNAGLYAMRRSALEPFRSWVSADSPRIVDFGKDLFPEMLRRGMHLHGYNSPEYIKDIGTPERLDKVEAEFQAGVVARGSFERPAPAVFIDRDGTLNEEADGLRDIDQLRLLPGAAEAVQMLNRAGLRVVVVTNQPVVAKGQVTEGQLRQIHNKLESLLGLDHAFVDRIYHCPHHPEKGHAGERPELKITCDCRKPSPGMLLRARSELNLDLSRSWMIGDTTVDMQCARNAGVRPLLVRTGHGGRDGRFPAQPDSTFDSLPEAAAHILKANPFSS